MATKDIKLAYGIGRGRVSVGWLGSYGGEDSPDDISRGLFAGEIGVPRLLKLFEKYGIKTSWVYSWPRRSRRFPNRPK